MAEMHKPSGRETPDQTYPTESGTPHPEPPPTESPESKRANTPETFEANAYELEGRVEDNPDLAHMTGGRETGLPETDAETSAPPLGLASSPERDDPAPGGDDASVRDERIDPARREDDASVRNEKEIVAQSQDEFPDQSMGRHWQWTTEDEERMPGDLTYGAVPFAALAVVGAMIAVLLGIAFLWRRR
ncbi:MAG TPA: hypothetical protein VFY79_01675 [Dehalococcoidia bacterium]|nr:hypothetical protein [Dehalococcoidia bacterium]